MAAVTARTRCWWAKIRMYGRRFPLKLKGVVNRSYVRLAILYGSETWRKVR